MLNNSSDGIGSTLIRWGIPGSVFFGTLFFFAIIDKIVIHCIYGPDTLGLVRALSISEFFQYTFAGLVALIVGASIPAGFVISQIYYAGFWSGVLVRSRRRVEKVLERTEIKDIDESISEFFYRELHDEDHLIRETLTRFLLSFVYLADAMLFTVLRFARHPLRTSWTLYHLLKCAQKTRHRILASRPRGQFKMSDWWARTRKMQIQIQSRERKQMLDGARQKRWLPPPLIRLRWTSYQIVRRDHYRWLLFSIRLRQSATDDEKQRLDRLSGLFDGLGTTFVASLIGAACFYVVLGLVPPAKLPQSSIVYKVMKKQGDSIAVDTFSGPSEAVLLIKYHDEAIDSTALCKVSEHDSVVINIVASASQVWFSKYEDHQLLVGYWSRLWARRVTILVSLIFVIFFYLVVWQIRRDIARHQLLLMRQLYDEWLTKALPKKVYSTRSYPGISFYYTY